MLKLEDFFGFMIDDERSDIQPLLETLGIEKEIESTKVVKTLIKNNGRQAPIINVARRQQVLKYIRPLLNEDMIDYEPNYYTKEINTSSNHDRRYGAEDRLLEFALVIASTKSKKVMADEPKILTVKQLREAAFLESRFDRCWEILSQETHHIVSAFRKSKK
ncbi:hypothetical protein [Aliikangiella coralliicola]|uniref:Uncharacterized protein n=1 Tax=Aliikangiella coralliicola TaxID=2592383 RepID=A0A545UAG7_9GAMM|nr:hypothetical protein [Aliikangiella coralliicola]TQV86459.1 hypothetical protein FLL46_16215 [Aliikangiella coralliicola]